MGKEIILGVEEDVEGDIPQNLRGTQFFTKDENLEEFENNIQDALRCHFEKDMGHY